MLNREGLKNRVKENVREMLEKRIPGLAAALADDRRNGNGVFCLKDVKETDDHLLVRFQGALDADTIPVVSGRYKNQRGSLDKHVIVDFEDVGHIDCSTLASLVNLFSELKEHNKELIIINASRELSGYVDILRLKALLKIMENEQEATEYLSREKKKEC